MVDCVALRLRPILKDLSELGVNTPLEKDLRSELKSWKEVNACARQWFDGKTVSASCVVLSTSYLPTELLQNLRKYFPERQDTSGPRTSVQRQVLVTDHQASAPKQASDAREAEAMNRSRCEKRKAENSQERVAKRPKKVCHPVCLPAGDSQGKENARIVKRAKKVCLPAGDSKGKENARIVRRAKKVCGVRGPRPRASSSNKAATVKRKVFGLIQERRGSSSIKGALRKREASPLLSVATEMPDEQALATEMTPIATSTQLCEQGLATEMTPTATSSQLCEQGLATEMTDLMVSSPELCDILPPMTDCTAIHTSQADSGILTMLTPVASQESDLCGACLKEEPAKAKTAEITWVQCSRCTTWFHTVCAERYNAEIHHDEGLDYICGVCI